MKNNKKIFSFSSLNFYYKWCLLRLFASLGCLNLRFALMQKKHKIKPENKKLKNYLKVPFRNPSRSSSTRGLLPLYFFVVFLCFLFKGGGRNYGF